ncbi:MAG: heavy metal translocating P-type ATPase [Vibrio sp.]
MNINCYHCGESVPTNTDFHVNILGENRNMCCPGCQSVAQTIVDHGLVAYYQFRTATAEKVALVPEQLKALLHYDDPDVQIEFVRDQQNCAEVTLSLDGISCAACAWLIEKQIQAQPGVLAIRVNTTTNRALLSWDRHQTQLSQVLAQIHQLGYQAAPFEADLHEANYHNAMQAYLYRLGIAGLASMQVMMLAVALYLETFGDLDAEFKHYFRWVSLIFATPVLLYSAQPFYINAWRSLRGKTLGLDVPVSLALIFAYVASLVATVTQQGEVFFESISMFTFFLLVGRFLEMRARRKAAAASGNLLKLIPALATTLDGKQVAVKMLKPDDTVRVLPGQHIPADGNIMNQRVYIDESMLTGESIPVIKHPGDGVFAGTLNGDESFDLRVTASKADSVISQIVMLQDSAQSSKPKIAELADIVARYFVAIILIIAAATWLYWHYVQPDDAFWIMLSVLVVTCPCALSLATPTALTCATSSLSTMGIMLRKSHVFETLCKVNQLVIDKTGTLTHGHIEIDRIETWHTFTQQQCLALAAELESYANHPIAKAFARYKTNHVALTAVHNIIGSGIEAIYQNKTLKIGSAEFALGSIPANSTPSNRAVNGIWLSFDGQHIATFHYRDPIRQQAKQFIEQFHQAGISITLLTGDSLTNAQTVANQLHIDTIIAQAKPEAKLAYLQQLNKTGVTMMVGDGINDAPTLAGAHLSVAMGGGTDIAKASADMILMGDRLDKLLAARALAIKTRNIIRENLTWSLGYNAIILPLAIAGLIAPYIAVIGMSASSMIVVANSLRLLNQKGN